MAVEHQGSTDGSGLRIAVAISRYSRIIARHLLDGALEGLRQLGCPDDAVEVYWVPGSFELPLLVRKAAQSGRYDAVIGLGCIIKGETRHNELIASEVAGGFARASQDTGVPVVFGVITADTMEQAVERAGIKSNGRGWEAAQTAVEMATLVRDLDAREVSKTRRSTRK